MNISRVVFLVERQRVVVITDEHGRIIIANTHDEEMTNFKYEWTKEEIENAVTSTVT